MACLTSNSAACCAQFGLRACSNLSLAEAEWRDDPRCQAKAVNRLQREEVKWLEHVRERPDLVYGKGPHGRSRSQHGWFKSWRGCFSCGAAGCCSGRGRCVHGVCACHDGSLGIDCRGDDAAGGGGKRVSGGTTRAPERPGPWAPLGADYAPRPGDHGWNWYVNLAHSGCAAHAPQQSSADDISCPCGAHPWPIFTLRPPEKP